MGLGSEKIFWAILVKLTYQARYKSRTNVKYAWWAQDVEIIIFFFTKYLAYNSLSISWNLEKKKKKKMLLILSNWILDNLH